MTLASFNPLALAGFVVGAIAGVSLVPKHKVLAGAVGSIAVGWGTAKATGKPLASFSVASGTLVNGGITT